MKIILIAAGTRGDVQPYVARLGELIRAEDGVAQAVAVIEQNNARA